MILPVSDLHTLIRRSLHCQDKLRAHTLLVLSPEITDVLGMGVQGFNPVASLTLMPISFKQLKLCLSLMLEYSHGILGRRTHGRKRTS